jgi:hypothetical protein
MKKSRSGSRQILEGGCKWKGMKTTTIHIFVANFLAVLGLSMTVLPESAAAAQTFCQQNGRGANGCSDLFDSGGYCWESTASNTGYICKEEDPEADVAPEEIPAVRDPILVTPGEPGSDPGEVQGLEIVICGPDGGAGCFTWQIADVCCDQVGLQHAEPMSVGGATITCYD